MIGWVVRGRGSRSQRQGRNEGTGEEGMRSVAKVQQLVETVPVAVGWKDRRF
jgi:hypothetical protein